MDYKKRCFVLLYISIIFVFLFSSLVDAREYGSGDCGVTVTEDSTLTGSISNCGENGINIGANGITFECTSTTIDGDLSFGFSGININGYSNVNIIGCTITDFATGISIANSATGTTVDTVTFDSNAKGMDLNNANFTILSSNIFTNDEIQFLATDSYNLTFDSNTVDPRPNAYYFRLDGGRYATISNNKFTSDNSKALFDIKGIAATNEFHNITGNTFSAYTDSALLFDGQLGINYITNNFFNFSDSALIFANSSSLQWNYSVHTATNVMNGISRGGNNYLWHTGSDTNDDSISESTQSIGGSGGVTDSHPLVNVTKFLAPTSQPASSFLFNHTFNATNPMLANSYHSTKTNITVRNATADRNFVLFQTYFNTTANFTNLTIAYTNSKVLINASGVTGVNETHTIFLPNTNAGLGVYYCPDATTLSDVSQTCSNALHFNDTNLTTGTYINNVRALIVNNEYQIQNATSSGAVLDGVQCGDTITTDTTMTYNLTSNGNNCLTFGSNSIVLDCNGYSINGDGSNYGIYALSKTGIEIRDCEINGFSEGIRFLFGSGKIIDNVTITNSSTGIFFGSTTGDQINSSRLVNNTNGIDLNSGAASPIIRHVTIANSTGIGINMIASGSVVTNVTLQGNSDIDGTAIYLTAVEGSNFTDVTIDNSSSTGIYMTGSTNNHFTNSTIIGTNYGFTAFGNTANTIFNTTFNSTQNYAINLTSSAQEYIFTNVYFYQMGKYGIVDETGSSFSNTLNYSNATASIYWDHTNLTFVSNLTSGDVKFANNGLAFNLSKHQDLNKTATVVLYSTGVTNVVSIGRSDNFETVSSIIELQNRTCLGSSCSLVSSVAGTIIFTADTPSSFTATASVLCGNVTATRNLTKDLTVAGTCFDVTSSDLELRGEGYSIYGTSGVGVNVSNAVANVNISNFLNIEGFERGVFVQGGGNITIFNNTIRNKDATNTEGVYVLNSFGINISNNTIYTYGQQGDGIRSIDSNNGSYILNVINTSGTNSDGISLSRSNYSQVVSNLIQTSGTNSAGLYLLNLAHNNSLYSNTVEVQGAQSDGIYLWQQSKNNSLYLNLVTVNGTSGGAMGIVITQESFGNSFTLNNITTKDSTGYGIYLDNSNNSIFTNNNINTTGAAANGIYLDSVTSKNKFVENWVNVSGATASALYLNKTTINNSFINNSFFSLNYNGIKDDTLAIYNNTLNYTTMWGAISWEFAANITATGNIALRSIGSNESFVFGNATIGFNSSKSTRLNQTFATVEVYGLNVSYNSIKKLNSVNQSLNMTLVRNDGVDCVTAGSCNILSFDSGRNMFRFTTSNFSVFSPEIDPGVLCGIVSESKTLTQDIQTTSSTCFTIGTSNIVLDCAGFRLTGYGNNVGIASDEFDNVSVTNCNIVNFSTSVSVIDGLNATVVNLTASNGTTGIGFTRVHNSTIFNSTIINMTTFGVLLSDSDDNNLSRLEITYVQDDAIYFGGGSSRNNLSNLDIHAVGDSASDGIINFYPGADFNTITNFIVNNTVTGGYGLQVSQADNNTFVNGTLYKSSYGFSFSSAASNKLENITVINASSAGIYIVSSYNNSLSDIVVNQTTATGLFFYSSTNNTLIRTRVYGSTDDALYLNFKSSNNTFVDLDIYAAGETANDGLILIDSGSFGNEFNNLLINSTAGTGYGIKISSGEGNKFINLTINGTDKGLLFSSTNNSLIDGGSISDALTYGVELTGTSANNTIRNFEIYNSVNYSIYDVSSSSNNLTFNNSMGSIMWGLTNLTSAMNLTINGTVLLQQNLTGLFSSENAQQLNGTATIELKGLNFPLTPHLRKNGVVCDINDTCNISSYSGGILTSIVSSFSNYTATANIAPNVTQVNFVNLPIYTNTSNITANVTVVDNDGENMTINVSWFVNSVLRKYQSLNVTNGSNFLVNFSYTEYDYNKTDVINVTIRAVDVLGVEFNGSNKTTVLNFEPTLLNFNFNQSTYYTNEDVNVSAMLLDPDLDTLTARLIWYVDNVQIGPMQTYTSLGNGTNLSDSFLSSSSYTKNQIVNVTYNLTDGTNFTYFATLAINISNSLPLVNQTVADISLTTDTSTTLDLTGYFTDLDNDDINYSINDTSLVNFSINNVTKILTVHGLIAGTGSFQLNVTDGQSYTNSSNFTVTVSDAVSSSSGGGGGSSSSGGSGGGGGTSVKKTEIKSDVNGGNLVCKVNEEDDNGNCVCKEEFELVDGTCVCKVGLDNGKGGCVIADKKQLTVPLEEIKVIYGEEYAPSTFFKLIIQLKSLFSFVGCLDLDFNPPTHVSQETYQKALDFMVNGEEFGYLYDVTDDHVQLYTMFKGKKGNVDIAQTVYKNEYGNKKSKLEYDILTYQGSDGSPYFYIQNYKAKTHCPNFISNLESGKAWIVMELIG